MKLWNLLTQEFSVFLQKTFQKEIKIWRIANETNTRFYLVDDAFKVENSMASVLFLRLSSKTLLSQRRVNYTNYINVGIRMFPYN